MALSFTYVLPQMRLFPQSELVFSSGKWAYYLPFIVALGSRGDLHKVFNSAWHRESTQNMVVIAAIITTFNTTTIITITTTIIQ